MLNDNRNRPEIGRYVNFTREFKQIIFINEPKLQH